MKAVKDIDAEIFVVDNQSTDGSKNFFSDKFPGVKFIWNKKNTGFAKANNMALAYASGEYVLFLNPDTIVPEDCFIKCIAFLQSHPNAGALGIRMIDGAGNFLKESKRSFPSPLISLYKLAGLAKLFPKSKTFAKYHLGHLDEHKNHEVDVLAGAFIMSPKKILEECKGFDEDFFMYGEDIDLSYRIQKAGYKNYYFADSTIIHFKGESTKKDSYNYVKIFYKAMSTFVNKHYSSSEAGTFNFLIQCAIKARAFISATGRFVSWIGVPLIDAVVILCSFFITKIVWNTFIKQEVNYSTTLLATSFIIFTLVFLLASYFSGLYDKGYRQSKLNRSAIAAIVALLVGYSLLPESLRFSRGILVFGSLLAYALITLTRYFLIHFKMVERNTEDENRYILIAGTPAEYAAARAILQSAGIGQKVIGRVQIDDQTGTDAVGSISNFSNLFKIYPVKEIILCEGELSFKKIIDVLKIIPNSISIKFFAHKSESIIGSDSKNIAGNFVTHHSNYILETPTGKRNKLLSDIVISIFILISFPLHFFLQKNVTTFFKNLFDVLSGKKTWVGFATGKEDLPLLKPGVISVTGLAHDKNKMTNENLLLADKWYARHFSVWHDVQLVFKSYKNLAG